MTLRVSETIDAKDWNGRVVGLQGPVQLTTEWTEFVSAKDTVRPLFVERDGEAEAFLAVVYLTRSARWPLSLWPSTTTDCLPLAQDVPSAISALEDILEARGCTEFHVNSYAATATVPLAAMGYTETRRLEFDLSLTPGLERVWKNFRPTMRQRIRQFETSGVACRERSDRAALTAFCEIETETHARHMEQGKFYDPTRNETFALLWTTLLSSGRARAYFAEKDGVPVAAAIIGICGARAYYVYGGATAVGLRAQAPKGLLWQAIQQEYQRGVREFNFGGLSADAARSDSLDHGLYEFKTGFGAVERLCISGHKVLRPWVSRFQRGARQFAGGLAARRT